MAVMTRQVTPQARYAGLQDPAFQAFLLLRVGFALAPVLFGLDKFFNLLTDWQLYLAPGLVDAFPGDARQLLYVIGAIEIAAGLLVAVRPRIGAYVVAGWLGGIIVSLLSQGAYYDIALRDFGLLLGALTLARLAIVFDRPTAVTTR